MEGNLSKQILVLNRLWQPVNIIGVKRGFGLLFQEHARVVHPIGDSYQVFEPGEWIEHCIEHPPTRAQDIIRTVRLTLRIPSILLLNGYDRLPLKEVRFSRQTVFERDHFECQYCDRVYPLRLLSIDHVIPRDRGGADSWENVVTCCTECNSRKANRLPHEAGMRLKQRPQRPRWKPFVQLSTSSSRDEAWTPFLHDHKKTEA